MSERTAHLLDELALLRNGLSSDRRRLEAARRRMLAASQAASELDRRLDSMKARRLGRLHLSERVVGWMARLFLYRPVKFLLQPIERIAPWRSYRSREIAIDAAIFVTVLSLVGVLAGSLLIDEPIWTLALGVPLALTAALLSARGLDITARMSRDMEIASYSRTDSLQLGSIDLYKSLDLVQTRCIDVEGEFFSLHPGRIDVRTLHRSRPTSGAYLYATSSIAAAMGELISAAPRGTGESGDLTVGLTRWVIRLYARGLRVLDLRTDAWTPAPDAEADMMKAAQALGALGIVVPSRVDQQASTLVLFDDAAWMHVTIQEPTPLVVPLTLPIQSLQEDKLDAQTLQLLVTEAINTPDPDQWLRQSSPALGGTTPEAVLPSQAKTTLSRFWETTSHYDVFSPWNPRGRLSAHQIEALEQTAAEFDLGAAEIEEMLLSAERASAAGTSRLPLVTMADWLRFRRRRR